MESQKNLTRQVYRNNRSKITFTLHPDIVKVFKSTAEEERLPMSIVADEALCRFKGSWSDGLDHHRRGHRPSHVPVS